MVKVHLLSKRTKEDLIKRLKQSWPSSIELDDLEAIDVAEIDEQSDLLSSDHFKAVRLGNIYLPFLSYEKILEHFPKVIVDAGAIRFICNGANIMRPGITAFEGTFRKGDVVIVQEERHHKYVAVGLALLDSAEASKMQKGAVVENLHYVGDKLWEAHKLLSRSI